LTFFLKETFDFMSSRLAEEAAPRGLAKRDLGTAEEDVRHARRVLGYQR
jgi:hypothetical protein